VKPADITSATEAEIAGDLTVDTNTLHVDAANNRVGVGTTSPADHLAVVASGANAHISVDRSDGATGRTVLIHSSSGGQLQTTGSVPLIFGTADTERGRFLSGGGLTFNGDTAAANALDDYEEGTWTPVVAFGGGTSGITYGTQFGRYVKIGEQVMLQCTISMTSKGSSSGAARIQGMPFNQGGTGFHCTGMQMFNFTGGTEYVVAQTAGGSNEVAVIRLGADQSLDASDFANNTGIRFSIVYRI
jgi:hypothetical protein